jgi:hypothetical protein
MVMPERLPAALSAGPEGPSTTTSAARVVAEAKVVSAGFTAVPKRRSFTAKYKRRSWRRPTAPLKRAVFQPFCGVRACIRRP